MKRRASRQWIAAAVAIAATTSIASAGNYYWDPSQTNTDPGSGGSGTWNTTSTFWKLAGNSGDVVWPGTSTVSDSADFADTAGTVTLGSAITTGSTGGLIFDTAGYTLNTSTFTLSLGTSGITVTPTSGAISLSGTITAAGAAPITVAAGATLGFAGTLSVASKSIISGGGTVNFSGNESLETGANDYAGVQGGTLNNTAGTLTLTPATGDSFYLGATGTTSLSSTLDVTGGVVQVTNNTKIFVGDSYNGSTSSAGDGFLAIGGGAGSATFSTGATTNSSNVLGSSVSTGTINLLTNGVLSGNRSYSAGFVGKGVVNFNGGTFQATGTAASLASQGDCICAGHSFA